MFYPLKDDILKDAIWMDREMDKCVIIIIHILTMYMYICDFIRIEQ